METKLYTNEPWQRGVTHELHEKYYELPVEDYERASKCVNACAGMDDPKAEIERLKAERDELLRALQVVEKAIQHDRSYQNTRAVIAKMLANYEGAQDA